MGLLSALYTGVSGLQSFGEGLQIIGDNIANTQTIGFKGARAEFSDLLSQTIGGAAGRSQIGRGVQLQNISTSFAQGSFTNTDRLTDLAVDGNGFFVLRENEEEYYTRNGQFTLDNEGYLVSNAGYRVQGYQFDVAGNPIISEPTDLQLARSTVLPNETTEVTMSVKLNSNAGIDTFDINDPSETSDVSTSITIYDELGERKQIQVYFTKIEDASTNVDGHDVWQYNAVVDGEEVGGVAGDLVLGARGTMEFDPAQGGVLVATTQEVLTPDGFDFSVNTQRIDFSFGPLFGNEENLAVESTQNDGQSVILTQIQDGYAQGELASIGIDKDGIVSGIYSNGRTLPIGQIALASFRNLNGLIKVGSGIYGESSESGQRTINRPNTAGLGTVAGYALELSNVDLATEFVNLIQTQRAYQANTKIITVGDQLLGDLTQLIR